MGCVEPQVKVNVAEPQDTKGEIIINANGIYDITGRPITHYYGHELFSKKDTVSYFLRFQNEHPDISEVHVKISNDVGSYGAVGEPSNAEPQPDDATALWCYVITANGCASKFVCGHMYPNFATCARRCAYDCVQDICDCPAFWRQLWKTISEKPKTMPLVNNSNTGKKACYQKFLDTLQNIRMALFPKHRVKG